MRFVAKEAGPKRTDAGSLAMVADHTLAEVTSADVLVVPSVFEPWGLVVHEGLAYGLPVITTDQVGAAEDLIEPGVNGYVVAPGSSEDLATAMQAVDEWTPGRWRAAAAHNRETLPRYGFDSAAEGFVQGCMLGLRHRRVVAGLGVAG